MIAERLRAEPHLLILDNLESITGTNLAIQNTLPKNEQDALRSFLADLAKGKTCVLLGSRGGEEWLAKGSFEDSIYSLPGLDDEAASMLAERILERNGATKYRENDDLRHLLKLLDGFPLALEVVLPNLVRQTPKDVLAALQAGDVNLDTGDPEDKTKSILRCIDYSHSNLSSEAQQLLLCLAPFTSIFDVGLLEDYTAQLKQQLSLAKLPFDHFVEVLQEAANWGLLSPDSDNPRFLHMQPVLSYFLRNRLNEPEQAESKAAVEEAFREHYRKLGGILNALLTSKEPQERQIGQFATGLEYENLVTALNLALASQESIVSFHTILVVYLERTQNQRLVLELFQNIEERFAVFSPDKLTGLLGFEYACIIAIRQCDLKQYEKAKASYQRALELVDRLDRVDEKKKSRLKALTYGDLGKVAQEQRQWQQAEQYYQQTLQIYVEYNDRYPEAGIYQSLGFLAQEQEHWAQAQRYYQQALQIYVECNDRDAQAHTYDNLGELAQEQRQWQQAEQYHQQALQIYIYYNDRYFQAFAYHTLGGVAQEQRQWQQAEQYYQQALQIYVEYNDRSAQFLVYGQLGLLAQEQQQWAQARDYHFQELEISVTFEDTNATGITLSALAILWHNSGDADLPDRVAERIGVTRNEAEERMRKMLEEGGVGGKKKKNQLRRRQAKR